MTDQTQTPGPSLAEAQLAVAVAALTRLSLIDEMAGMGQRDGDPELTARCKHAAGTLATIQRLATEAPLEPFSLGDLHQSVVSALDSASGGACEHCVSSAFTKQADAVLRIVAEFLVGRGFSDESEAEATVEPEAEPPPVADPELIPAGTFVHVAVKGFIEVEGYLETAGWLGALVTVLRDADGKFAALVPRDSVHLITAVPEPGSQPEQPDPWSEPSPGFGFEAMRAEVEATRRLLAAANLKTAALAGWTTAFVDGDATALAEVREIFERDFTQEAADAEPPF